MYLPKSRYGITGDCRLLHRPDVNGFQRPASLAAYSELGVVYGHPRQRSPICGDACGMRASSATAELRTESAESVVQRATTQQESSVDFDTPAACFRANSRERFSQREHSARNCDNVDHKIRRGVRMRANSSPAALQIQRDSRKRQIRAAQVRMLYGNVNVGVAVTLVAATILGRLQWAVIPHVVVLGWWLCMLLIAVARFTLGWRYRHIAPSSLESRKWETACTMGAGLAGAGWGAAGILLYAADRARESSLSGFHSGGNDAGSSPFASAATRGVPRLHAPSRYRASPAVHGAGR